MTSQEHARLLEIVNGEPWKVRVALSEFLKTAKIVEEEKGNYTDSQRGASWRYMELKANQLNEAGLDQRVVLKPEYAIPWTKIAFHDHIWIPIQRALYGTDSMRLLKKDQPGHIHEVIERELGEKHGVEHMPFPSTEALRAVQFEQQDNKKRVDYPEYNGPTAFE